MSGEFSDDLDHGVRGGKKDNPLIVPSGKEESKDVSFEGEGVPKIPHPGEQAVSPGLEPLSLQHAAKLPPRLPTPGSVEPLTLTARWCGRRVKAWVLFR